MTAYFKAPEDGLDISREHSLKGAVFIVMSIESDNNILGPSYFFFFSDSIAVKIAVMSLTLYILAHSKHQDSYG